MKTSSLAPIVLFAFNRPKVFQRLIESLKANLEFKYSDVYVFIDGARKGRQGEQDKVGKVKEIAYILKSGESGFPQPSNVHIQTSSINRGLASSIISGVTSVIGKYGKAIVLEDDLYLAPNCLRFMNEGLDRYEKESSIFSICGYTNRIKVPSEYEYGTYVASRSSSWGWATWKDRWDKVDWELKDWDAVNANKRAFNKWGGSDCFHMLKGWHDGKTNSWAIRFCYAQFINHAWSVFPNKSLIKNDGFDGTGTNMKRYSRFKFDFDESNKSVFNWCPYNIFNRSIQKQILHYASIPLRVWSKLMYIIKG